MPNRRDDPNHVAARTVRAAGKDPHAVALGRRGGQARAARMTKAQRTASARRAAIARWSKKGAG